MDVTPLYAAAGICGFLGLFIGFMSYMDHKDNRHSFNVAVGWIVASIGFLLLAFIALNAKPV